MKRSGIFTAVFTALLLLGVVVFVATAHEESNSHRTPAERSELDGESGAGAELTSVENAVESGEDGAGGEKEEEDEEAELPAPPAGMMVCKCFCCYLGDCSKMENSTTYIKSCEECTTERCYKKHEERALQRKTGLQLLQDNPKLDSAFTSAKMCQIAAALQEAQCGSRFVSSGNSHKSARCLTTSFQPKCIDRSAPFIRVSLYLFVAITVLMIVMGFVKNHIPALQEFNARHFDY